MQLFCSPAAEAIKQEIVRAGKKLWDRQYVDGNGGNISARISDSYVICTPTLCSKGDLRAEELALVDLENNKIVGCRPQTSEILLHLEIYKLVPKAKAIIHCHPPYATAHAIAGTIPPGNLVPEQEVFIGPVAFAPYETPGTLAFARTVLPFAKRHNTCLLANHGIVTWSDSVTHAEWNVEVLETFCKTVTIASQLGNSLQEIPPDKLALLLDFKKTWGLPDARFPEDSGCEEPTQSYACDISEEIHPPAGQSQLEELVSKMTEQVIGYLKLEQ
jgi:L-fuculose-phosphate aldolase